MQVFLLCAALPDGLKELDAIKKYCTEKNGAFLYASNFSIGVNLFFALNNYLASLMSTHNEYNVSIEEVITRKKKMHPAEQQLHWQSRS